MENGIHWTMIVGDVVSGWLVLSSKFWFVCLTCLCFAFGIHQTFVWGHSSVTCCLLLCRWRFLYISEFILRILKYYETRIGLEWEPCKISFGKGLEPPPPPPGPSPPPSPHHHRHRTLPWKEQRKHLAGCILSKGVEHLSCSPSFSCPLGVWILVQSLDIQVPPGVQCFWYIFGVQIPFQQVFLDV